MGIVFCWLKLIWRVVEIRKKTTLKGMITLQMLQGMCQMWLGRLCVFY